MPMSAARHKSAMQKQKSRVDSGVEKADIGRGICIFLTGNGKGKTTSAFGMVFRALGYAQKVGIVQFIKGTQQSGEELFVSNTIKEGAHNGLFLYQMGTGFTWDTQDRELDIAAAKETWEVASKLLADPSYDLIILDELTYMLAFDYLDEDEIISVIENRPESQSVVVTGRGGGGRLREIADTVSEIKEIKHAYRDGIEARKGLDY